MRTISPPGPPTAQEPVMAVCGEMVDDAGGGTDALSLESKEDSALDDDEPARIVSLEKVRMSLMAFRIGCLKAQR
jgi:hypothetical protein